MSEKIFPMHTFFFADRASLLDFFLTLFEVETCEVRLRKCLLNLIPFIYSAPAVLGWGVLGVPSTLGKENNLKKLHCCKCKEFVKINRI